MGLQYFPRSDISSEMQLIPILYFVQTLTVTLSCMRMWS